MDTIEGIIIALFLAMLGYVVIRRLGNKKKETFEDRSN